MIVDDSPLFREAVAHALKRAGIDSVAAADGAEAWAAMEAVRPDLILLDLSMPTMNGRQFLRQLRIDPRFSQTPVILISGLPESAAGPWAADRHLLGRLAKGRFGLSELVERVTQALTTAPPFDGTSRPP